MKTIRHPLVVLAVVVSSSSTVACGRAGDAVLGAWNITAQTYAITDNDTDTESYSSDADGGTFEFIAGDPDNAVQGTFLRTLKVVPDRSQIEGGYADVPSPQTRTAGWQPGGFDSETFDDAMITVFDADNAFNGIFTIESQGFGELVLRHDYGQDFGGGATRAETWTYTLQTP